MWHKGPGESQFTQVETTVSGEYTAFGLPGGMHAYKIMGVNAADVGAASEPSSIDVEQAQAELAAKGEQNLELIKAKIETTRKKLEGERSDKPVIWN